MVETVSQSQFNFSSDYTPFTFASTMRTCYANNKTPSISSGSDVSSSSASSSSSSSHHGGSLQRHRQPEQANSPNLSSKSGGNLESRRSSCGEIYLRNSNSDYQHPHHCNNKRCSNTITTTCLNGSNGAKASNKPKLQLTTTTFEDAENHCLSSCTTQLSTPQSNGMISQKHQFSFDQHLGHQAAGRMSTSCGGKQKRSESLGLFRQSSEIHDGNNSTVLTSESSSFDDNHENSNSSDDLVFSELQQHQHHHHSGQQPKSPRQLDTFVLCKKCGSSNSSLTSFSSMSSSVSSTNNLNQYTLTNGNCSAHSNAQDTLINNLSHSLNQTFNFSNGNSNSLSTPQYGRSRHNSINSHSLCSGQPDRNLHALHQALHNIFSN